MVIDRKRRIFRPAGLTLGRPTRAALLTAAAGALVFVGGAWLGLRPSEAPASGTPPGRLSAEPGQVRVIDGTTLMLHDRAVQLAGLRTAERGTACGGAAGGASGAVFDCGVAAANALADRVRGAAIDCVLLGGGQSGRPLAHCSAAGAAIAPALVASGWARVSGSAGNDARDEALAEAERRAQAAHLGLWAGAR